LCGVALAFALLRQASAPRLAERRRAMKRAAADFFAPASAKAPRAGASWRVVREGAGVYLLRADPQAAPSPKVAAFDMARRRCAALLRAAALTPHAPRAGRHAGGDPVGRQLCARRRRLESAARRER